MPAEQRTCPICWNPFTATGRNRRKHTYCSDRCRSEAGHRRTRQHQQQQPADTAAPRPYQPEPAAVRDCPHCGQPVTIVALLTTPQVAQPVIATPNVIPLHPAKQN